MLSEPARRQLLEIARRAIEQRLRGLTQTPLGELPDELGRMSGAFVTLRRKHDRELRGCVGYVEPRYPLAQAVALAAVAAATNDARFDPVTLDELALLALDVSVLGPTFPIAASEVVVGRHGLVIEKAGCRGLLLPQVAIEWGWDATTFLEQTCRKAGLPTTAWREPGAALSAFEAELLLEESA
jgi:AmmeMemoRadiSam system protein A